MGALLVAQLLLGAAGDLQARVQVRLSGDRVSVRADAAPLSLILDSLAQRTGMKVVWEKNLGRPNVTATLEDCTPAEAVIRLLQGSGFNYALSMDPSGTRVETLLIVGAPLPEPPGRPAFIPPRRSAPPPAAPGPEVDELSAEEPAADFDPTGGDDASGSQPGIPSSPVPDEASAAVPPAPPGPTPPTGVPPP